MIRFFHLKFFKPLTCLQAGLLYSLSFGILYHFPLFAYAYKESSQPSLMVVIAVALFCANGILFLTLSLISSHLMRFFAIVFSMLNSVALYFISTYGVFLNKSMMSNVLNTNTHEVLDFLSVKLFLFIAILGILPSYLIYKIPLKRSFKKPQFLALLVLVAIFIANALINAKTWLWFDKHAKSIGGLSLPFAYSVNAFRVSVLKLFSPTIKPLPLFLPNASKSFVVLVIGESARKHNYALYGYEKPTTPRLSKRLKNQEITLFDATSCATYTTASLECILDSSFKDGFSTYENLPTYLTKAGIKVFWYSANDGEKNVKVTRYLKRSELIKKCRTCKEIALYDEALLYNVPNLLKEHSNENVLLILHLAGSHGPRYDKKVPLNFRVFKPYCSSVDLSRCSKESLMNAYDNTIFYNDFVLDKLISMLKNTKQPTLMLYLSDHGESLGEGAYYLHGIPKSIAPKEQYEIPFILYANKLFKEKHSLDQIQTPLSQNVIFHSILGVFESFKIPNAVYQPHLDLFKHKKE
ncbi:phosphoethanolamine--lipid A transferase EptA [Helicobacter cetorum]|uniref:Lipid A phosphoethanolamine transferase n=1 Tax=Helicobacter cetorum (strain ATCC BAA-540 / CCUG 52418 / MIT 99-5656) TaxID=1163745 RepID=I0EQ44_HELCM|nr:phosphoethanolamine--lipid A transferase EptA [Helicobacter cetorum]AFI05063.1 lipid A phosphoethanolamine transferase [Helicobacter cetorum MIT 99-5656]